MIGLNTHRTGRGFYVARPIDEPLQSTIADLASGKSVSPASTRCQHGATEVAAKLRASVGLPDHDGLLVRGVEADGPAANAGIVEGDLLVAAGDTPLTSIEALHDVLANVGETLSLTVVRGNDERTVEVVFAKA